MCQKMRTEGEKGSSIKIDKGAQRYNSNKDNKKECNEKIYKKIQKLFRTKSDQEKALKKGREKIVKGHKQDEKRL